VNGAEVIVRFLEANDVEFVFGVPGDIQVEFADAVRRSAGVRFITAHNEKCAGFMADIHGRVKGRVPGVCFSTVGPGAANLVGALANATQDRAALLAISDQLPTDDQRRDAHQYLDLGRLFHPDTGVTKWNAVVGRVGELPAVLDAAYRHALTEPRGAVHVAVPSDVMRDALDAIGDLRSTPAPSPRPDRESIDRVHRRIACGGGIVIAGGAVQRTGAGAEFRAFVERARFPVLSTFRGKGALGEDHPLSLGTMSRHFAGILDPLFAAARFVLAVGYDYNEGVKPSAWGGADDRVVNVDAVDNRVAGVFAPEVNCFGDLRETFRALAEREYGAGEAIDLAALRARIRTTLCGGGTSPGFPLRPHTIIEAIESVYAQHAIVIGDVGLNKYYTGLLARATEGRRVLFSNGQSAMGFTSGALGAKLAAPDHDVLAVVGDGGFLMEPQELATAVRYHVPLTVVVFDDGGLGLTRREQLRRLGSSYEVDFAGLDYPALARGLGAEGGVARSAAELERMLREARANGRVNVIAVPVDYGEPL
jgi:acetolactate synthase-1/2/3 large subunit